MQPKSPTWLDDTARACRRIGVHTRGFSHNGYKQDQLVRNLVERNLLIVGEAFSRLARIDPNTAADYRLSAPSLGFRTDSRTDEDKINNNPIGSTVATYNSNLLAEIERLLEERKPRDDVNYSQTVPE